MKFLKYPAYLGLALTIIPPALHLLGSIESFGTTKTLMLVGMVLWYAAATPWLALQKEPEFDDSTRDQF
jgi:hypothetical protein